MPEDKLTAAQRLRLESFAQALNSAMTVRIEPARRPFPPTNVEALHAGIAYVDDRPTMADVFARAEEIEEWLSKAGG